MCVFSGGDPRVLLSFLFFSVLTGGVRAREDRVELHRIPGQQGLHRAYRQEAERDHPDPG